MSGDDLGDTLPARPGGLRPATAAVATTIGRYTIERQLGAGGMGVVHLALDPSLQRKVALKVLHDGRSDELAERLLREARAMAKLTHPNVVTVYEAGTAGGVDYVAMELFDGESLDAWWQAAPRSRRQILDAFTDAGRGLVAAHAAGLIHRDFKPHNVLRNRAGRVAVTDFGLAREVAAVDVTRSRAAAPRTGPAPEVSTTLTQTGAIMGTPAYMAPEQWAGALSTRASDQFSFCVSLWEALAGERPYRADSLEGLCAQVLDGPDAIDARKIPRGLRPILRRGLAVDPAARWPSMEALLTAIARVRRRPRIAMTLGAGAAALALIAVLVVTRSTGGAQAPCPAPAIDPEHLVSDADLATLTAAHQPVAARSIRAYLDTWRGARARMCKGPAAERGPRSACLDALLSRLGAATAGLVEVATAAPDAAPVNIAARLTDVEVCFAPEPPRLVMMTTPQRRLVTAAAIRREALGPGARAPAASDQVLAQAEGDACATAIARALARSADPDQVRDVDSMVERCDDDIIRAVVARADAHRALKPGASAGAIQAAVDRLAAALDRLPSPRSKATLLDLQARVAIHHQDWDAAIAARVQEVAIYADLGDIFARISATASLYELRKLRPTAADAAHQQRELTELRAAAARALPAGDRTLRMTGVLLADWTFLNEDDVKGHAMFEQLREPLIANRPARRVSGRVVDRTGAAVAGATVFVDRVIKGDAISAALAIESTLRSATTGADGRFEIADAVTEGVAVAQLGDRRSMPRVLADDLVLTLAETSEIVGTVDLRGVAPVTLRIYVFDPEVADDVPYVLVAAVKPDGTFRLRGVPRKRVHLELVVERDGATHAARDLMVDQPVIAGLTLTTNPPRAVHVLVRSTVEAPLGAAWISVMTGAHESAPLSTMDHRFDDATGETRWGRLIGATTLAALGGTARPGDFHVVVKSAPRGLASACAIGYPGDVTKELSDKIQANQARIEVRCVPLATDATVVVIEVPPLPRLD